MNESDTQTRRWVIEREVSAHDDTTPDTDPDANADPDTPSYGQYLTKDQTWGRIEDAIVFDTEAEANNGAATLCPPFMPGHAARFPRQTESLNQQVD